MVQVVLEFEDSVAAPHCSEETRAAFVRESVAGLVEPFRDAVMVAF
jgi:hypothetical protein